jgi:hypothetical protein
VIATTAGADWIRFRGTRIALEGVRVEQVSGSELIYADARGGVLARPLDEIDAIGFDGRPQLDRAESEIDAGRLAASVDWLAAALLDSQRDVERRWIRARLAQVHDALGEGAAAAGHLAALIVDDPDLAWLRRTPVSPLLTDDPAVGREALHRIDQARRLPQPALREAAERWHRQLAPKIAAMGADVDGATDPALTVSGRTPEAIARRLREITEPAAPEPVTGDEPPARQPEPPVAPVRTIDDTAGPDAPGTIDRLLDDGRYDEATEACGRVAAKPGDRDLGRFLHQFGRAYAGASRPHDAALMFARSAVLFPDSTVASRCLIELAVIYRDVYERPATARRLLERAAETAALVGRDADRTRAESILNTLAPVD